MGLFARWFKRGPAARLERAGRSIEKGEYADARWEVEGLEGAEADALRAQALAGLAELNLREAQARFSVGDSEEAQAHIDLAREYGATHQQVREAQRQARLEREADRAEQAQRPPPEPEVELQGDDPIWSLPPDDPRVRYAMMLEAWPEALRARLVALGGDFAAAVLMTEEGTPAEAHKRLADFVSRDPVARFERAKAAVSAGLLPAAASDLAAFGDEIGHLRLGPTHTAVMHAQILLQLRRGPEAIERLQAEAAKTDDLGVHGTLASAFEAVGRLDEAAVLAERLMRDSPRDLGLVRLVARVNVKKGQRQAAMQVLEGGLTRCCSSPGKCGNQPFDADAGRMLAQLYLEDRVEPKRTRELLDELTKVVQEPRWEDRYLAALVARNDGLEAPETIGGRLLRELGPDDGRRTLVAQSFPEAARLG